jgi:coproporphyrinogen III oxidase-like Fe-S oxidoreductase
LRLSSGISIKALTARFGAPTIRQMLKRVHPLEEGGWIILDKNRLKTTSIGTRLLDTLLLELIPS